MKKTMIVLGCLVCALVFQSCAKRQAAPESLRLDTGWKFQYGDDLKWLDPGFDDSAWKTIRPDRLWESQGYDGYDGYAWYRVRFRLPALLRDGAVLKDSLQIVLGKIDDTDQAFLNGRLIGQNAVTVPGQQAGIPENFTHIRTTYDLIRRYVLPAGDPRIRWDGENVLAVRVHDHGGGGGLYTQVPVVSMVDMKDYIRIEAMGPFEVRNRSEYAKEVMLANYSGMHDFKGSLNIRVVQIRPEKILYNENAAVDLARGTKHAFKFQFTASPTDPCRVVFTFIEEKTKKAFSARQPVPYVLTPPPPESPRINGPRVYGCRPGRDFLFRIPATGIRPMTFSAEGLPGGLKLDAGTGVISGRVRNAGTYPVLLSAANDKGMDRRSLKIEAGDRIALTPPMGWNSWNCWGLSVDDARVREAADFMESTGLADHGWSYINIDDGWEAPGRRPNGEIEANEKFPDMKGLSDDVHAKGLKLGIYSSPGPYTCGGFLGSYEHELQDVKTYAKWGIDYLKYDWCSYGTIAKDASLGELKKPYELMRDVLRKVQRDIVYSLCQYGMGKVWEWGAEVDGNLWRTTGDITDTWKSMAGIGFEQTVQWEFAAPGRWNDPDMLVVGWVGWGPRLHPTQLSVNEQYTHISLWCLLSAPLLLGCDLSKLDDFTLSLLTNDEVLAVNQDPLGRQARQIRVEDSTQVWAKQLEDGSMAVGLFNLDRDDGKASASWADLGLSGSLNVRDLWHQQDVGTFTDKFEAEVYGHGVVLVRIGPK